MQNATDTPRSEIVSLNPPMLRCQRIPKARRNVHRALLEDHRAGNPARCRNSFLVLVQFLRYLPCDGFSFDFVWKALGSVKTFQNFKKNGRGVEIRTHDLLYPKQAR